MRVQFARGRRLRGRREPVYRGRQPAGVRGWRPARITSNPLRLLALLRRADHVNFMLRGEPLAHTAWLTSSEQRPTKSHKCPLNKGFHELRHSSSIILFTPVLRCFGHTSGTIWAHFLPAHSSPSRRTGRRRMSASVLAPDSARSDMHDVPARARRATRSAALHMPGSFDEAASYISAIAQFKPSPCAVGSICHATGATLGIEATDDSGEAESGWRSTRNVSVGWGDVSRRQ